MASSGKFRKLLLGHGLTLGSEIGSGGQSAVFLAEDPEGVTVAVKRLRNLDRLARFDREVATMKELVEAGCGAIPPVVGSASDASQAFFWMPFYVDGSLQSRLERGSVTEPIALCCELIDALDSIHSFGVAHRDVKPDNILFAESRPLLADFGLCLSVDDARVTYSFEQAGSRFYMAPELGDGRADGTDHRPADLYSLAKVIWCVLTGRTHPYAREDEHFAPDHLPSLIRADPRLRPVESRLQTWMSVRPEARLTVNAAEMIDALTSVERPPHATKAVLARPSVLTAIANREAMRQARIAQEQRATRESDAARYQDRLDALDRWLLEVQQHVIDTVQASDAWQAYCDYGQVAPDTLQLMGIGSTPTPLWQAIGMPGCRVPLTTSSTSSTPDGSGSPFLASRLLWCLKVSILGEDNRLFGLEAIVGTEEVGYYLCALRDIPGVGWILDPNAVTPAFEYHPPKLESTANRGAELATHLTFSVVQHIERSFVGGEDPAEATLLRDDEGPDNRSS